MKKIKTYSRRDFLRLAGLGVTGSLVAGCSGMPMAMPAGSSTDVGVPPNGTSGNIPAPGPNNAGFSTLTPNLAGEKNILLIIADDMGADKASLSLYNEAEQSDIDNNTLPSMPTVERLATNGVLFENTWAQPTCTPTRSTLFTGTHPFVNGGGSPQTPEQFEPKGDTLPEILKKAGYVNAIFGKWHLGEGDGRLPLDRGWDYHVGIWGGGVGGYAKAANPLSKIGRGNWPKVQNNVKGNSDLFADWELTHEAYHWIKGHKDQKWSATMAYMLPHDPYDQPPTQVADITVPLGTADKDIVNAGFLDQDDENKTIDNALSSKLMAEYLDNLIDTLLTELDNLGVLKDTLIFFIGDNGTHDTAFVPSVPPPGTPQVFILQTKKGTVYSGGVRVPFIVTDGNNLAANPDPNGSYVVNGTGRKVSDHAHVVDLYQTIAVAAGANADDGIHSADLTPYLLDTTHPNPRQENFSQYYGDNQGIQATIVDQNNQYKLNYQDGCYQLFDIQADPKETDSLFDSTDPNIIAARDDLLTRLKNNYAPTSRRRSKFPDCNKCSQGPQRPEFTKTDCGPTQAKITPVTLADFL